MFIFISIARISFGIDFYLKGFNSSLWIVNTTLSNVFVITYSGIKLSTRTFQSTLI